MLLIIMLIIVGLASSAQIMLSNLGELDISNLETEELNTLLFSECSDRDELLEETKNLAKALPFLSKKPDHCFYNILKIVDLKEIQNLSQPSEYVNFIKDPCLTFLTIYKNHQDLEQALKIKIPGQPYFFATNLAKDQKIYEVQTYSNNVKEIGLYDTTQRGYDLNGATIRILDVQEDSFHLIIPLLKKKLNFTTEVIDFRGYGSLVDGKWNGAIKQLLNHELDIASIGLTQTGERLMATNPGFGLIETETLFVFSKSATESISSWAILTIFTTKSWLLIGIAFFLLIFFLTALFSKQISFKVFAWSIVVLAKAFLVQSVDTKFIDKFSQFKKSKSMMICNISLLGGFLFWCFTGVLISLLTIPSKTPLIESLDDLHTKQSFVLHFFKSGYMETNINNWARENSVNRELYEKFIVPNGKVTKEEYEITIKAMSENNDPNEALIISRTHFEKMLRDSGVSPTKFSYVTAKGFPRSVNGWMYPKNSILRKIFDDEILKLDEDGISDKLIRNHDFPKEPNEFIAVDIDFVLLVFATLPFGIFLSLMTFSLERRRINIFGNFNEWP